MAARKQSRGRQSAGLVMYRRSGGEIRVLLVHPGGPFWARKDLHAWSIPKGEYAPGDDPKDAALREFEEELGSRPAGEPVPLGEVVQRGGKRVTAFAVEGEFDVAGFKSNTCEIEWPPRSGKTITIPEIDRAEWFSLERSAGEDPGGQLPLLERLEALLG